MSPCRRVSRFLHTVFALPGGLLYATNLRAEGEANPGSLIPGVGSLIPGGGLLQAALTQQDCEVASRNGMIISGVVALFLAFAGVVALKMLANRLAHGGRFGIGVSLSFCGALLTDFYVAKSGEQLYICLNAVELCKYVTLCGSHQAFRSLVFAAVPAAVLFTAADLGLTWWGHRH